MPAESPGVVVIGGGYAGLAALLELRVRLPRARLTLVDPAAAHLKVTQLHRTTDRPLRSIEAGFDEIAERHRITHVRHAVDAFDAATLERWQADGAVESGGDRLAFDALVVATGNRPVPLPGNDETLTLDDLRRYGAGIVTERLAAGPGDRAHELTVVGGGATGLQFLFEIGDYCRSRRLDVRLRLVNADRYLLDELPRRAHDYVRRRLDECGYDYYGGVEYLGQTSGRVTLRETGSGETLKLDSDTTLLFPGVRGWPDDLLANAYGQAVVDEVTLPDVYLAGDCARWRGQGLDTLTAQAAVRKGKHVAMNIARAARGSARLAYDYRALGYVVSLGPYDAVGWMLTPYNVLTGLAAFAISEAVEKQYDLFVSGIDTYLL